MSERSRAGLTGLKRPLVQPGPPVVPLRRLEEHLLGSVEDAAPFTKRPQEEEPSSATPTSVPPEIPVVVQSPVQSPVQSEVLPETLRNRKAREPLTAWTLKLPLSLHRELKMVAQHNEIGMTSIVIDALRQYLPQFPHPEKKTPGGR